MDSVRRSSIVIAHTFHKYIRIRISWCIWRTIGKKKFQGFFTFPSGFLSILSPECFKMYSRKTRAAIIYGSSEKLFRTEYPMCGNVDDLPLHYNGKNIILCRSQVEEFTLNSIQTGL